MNHLTAEIIAIGDEMISGARLDTNTQWLSVRLGELGVDVIFHTTIGDTLSHNADGFRIATRRADIVVATGGLGPTRDDLTRDAVSQATGKPLRLDEASLRHIETLFAHRGRDMPERNRIQAMFPLGSVPIVNPQGTAPGIDMGVPRDDGTASRIFALPGVPAEMKSMFDEHVAPAVLAMRRGDEKFIRHSVMKFFGVGESDMEQRLGDMIDRQRQPRVGITVSGATISLRISARGNSVAACEQAIAATRDEIIRRVGELHFGDGESFEQQHAVDVLLRDRGQRLLVMELGYAAPIADWLAALGPSPALAGGLSLATADDLRVLAPDVSNVDPVALLTAIADRWKADWVLVVDAYPDLSVIGDAPVPAADVSFGVLTPDRDWVPTTDHLGGHPSIMHPRIAKAGLAWLRKCLAGATARSSL